MLSLEGRRLAQWPVRLLPFMLRARAAQGGLTLTQRKALSLLAEVRRMSLTVSQVARLAGVSVRTLHHYDAIALLCPSGRSEAGYRLYEQEDLQRLQQVLFFKELGFALEEIARIVGDPAFDLRAALLI